MARVTFPGAERVLSFEVESGLFLERALPLRFSGSASSPYLAETGTWTELGLRLAIEGPEGSPQ